VSFSFLGVFRQTQWFFFRSFLLNERKIVDPRIRVINAELLRIGSITMFYGRRADTVRGPGGTLEVVTVITEQREAMMVTPGSSLEKLFMAYIAQGGNPTDLSLYLQPDSVLFTGQNDPEEDPEDDPDVLANDKEIPGVRDIQPYFGVVAAESTTGYGPGGRWNAGMITFSRDPYRRIGREIDLSDAGSTIAVKMDYARRWANQGIQEKRNLMEQRILKLLDLREQLMLERDELLVQAVGGTVNSIYDPPNPDRFHRGLHLTRIVAMLDSVFYVKTDGVPDFNSIHLGTGAKPEGLALYDTLFGDDPTDDKYSTA
jgi:hypothetical protein